MKVYKIINVDNKLISQLADPGYQYTAREKKILSILYENFAQGNFQKCAEMMCNWTRKDRELVDCIIYDILWEYAYGGHFSTYSNLHKEE